MILLTFSDILS